MPNFDFDRHERRFNFLWRIGIVVWVLSALAGLVMTGLVIYLLYRLAIHPW